MKNLLNDKDPITHQEAMQLGKHLRGWNVLNELFKEGEIPEDTLQKLISIEYHGHRRAAILERLIARLGRNFVKRTRSQFGLKPAGRRKIKKKHP